MIGLFKFAFILPLFTISFFNSPFSSETDSNSIETSNDSTGSSQLKLLGQFNGIGANIDANKYIFNYLPDSDNYYLKIELSQGDIFYIYQMEKTRALYYPIFNESACDLFESIGLERSHYSGSNYFWKVGLSGTYEFTIDSSIETLNSAFDIWNENYSSSISYSFNNSEVCYFIFEADKTNRYYFRTKKPSCSIYQYGKKTGSLLYITNNVIIYGNTNHSIVAIKYDKEYSSFVDIVAVNEKDEIVFESLDFGLKNGFCYFSLFSHDGDYEYGKIVSVLYDIEADLGNYVADEKVYENCVLSITQKKAYNIIANYDSLNDYQKIVVDNSEIDYVDSSLELKKGCLIKDIISEIRDISVVPYVFPVFAVIIPSAVVIIGSALLFYLLYFKKRDS